LLLACTLAALLHCTMAAALEFCPRDGAVTAVVVVLMLVLALPLHLPVTEAFELGEIVMFGGNFAIRNWMLCEGQLLSIAAHT